MKIYKKIIIGFTLIMSLIIATFITWVYSQINSALPILNGKENLFGLSSTVIVSRDAQGIPTIKGNSRQDIAIATGFIHAQERFFQMDLLRRNSAGELSSLFGEVALDYDKSIRRHRFRDRAREIVKQLPSDELALLKAYTRGVNQGLDYLKSSPFEYLLLRQEPVEWQEEDTILTVFSMYIDLQYDKGERERTLDIIHSELGNDVYQFLAPNGSIWDAAIDQSQYASAPMPIEPWPILPASISQVSTLSSILKTLDDDNLQDKYQSEQFPGSNNWAVSGEISQTGAAIVANDMHLGIRVPNTWFRASFEYVDQSNNPIKVTGVTLPGTPNMVVGSNGNIAWGFTNSYGDWSDVIILDTNEDASEYLTPDGYIPFSKHKQIIAIKGQESVEIVIKETIWGPVIGTNENQQLLAYRWVAHDKEAVNFHHAKLELTHTVDEAFLIAAKSGIPAQNFMVGDKDGNIGWTIMGPIPRKKGTVGNLPSSWSDGSNNWLGYLSPEQYPSVKNPSQQRLWTANSRVVGGEMYNILGNGGYAIGARSQQIRDDLMEKSSFNEQDLLAIALDDKAVFLKRWQQFLLENVLTKTAITTHAHWQEAQAIVNVDELRATTDSVAYRLVSNFRMNVRTSVFKLLNQNLSELSENYSFHTIRHQIETPLWQLINEQPSNFLGREEDSWQALFEQALEETLTDMTAEQKLSQATWGKQNTTQIRHPLSKSVPFIGRWLDMPSTELAGDSYMPRVQGIASGASERMVVSPGHEETGILHMPTSQAGHPWSPYYGVGHSDWEQGKPSPLLPGKTIYTLTLLSY